MAITRDQLESLYKEFEIPLYNFALRWVFDFARAEEIVQDAYVRVWKRRDQVETSTAKSLLYKTVQNLAINDFRWRRVRESFQLSELLTGRKNETLETKLIEAEELRELKKSLDRLPFALREVLMLTEFADLSYEQIAEILGVASGTVASRRNRAIEKLKEERLEL